MIKYTIIQKFDSNVAPVRVVQHAKLWKFPGGEVGAAMLPGNYACVIRVDVLASCTSSDEFMQLVMFLDATQRKYPGVAIHLTLPYLPYARQDRVCNDGESLSIAVIANIINSFNLSKIRLVDVHSDVSLALFNNIEHVTQAEIWKTAVINDGVEVLIAPDAGAAKKIYALAEMVQNVEVVIANKKRDLRTGAILETTVSDIDVCKGKVCAIVDDICDGGRTFTELSNVIRHNCGSLNLYVTHGIFSKGEDVVANCFDKVKTTASYRNDYTRVEVVLDY